MPPEAIAPAFADAARRISVPLATREAIAGSYDADAHTVELVIATETLVRTPGWQLGLIDDYYFEILDCRDGAVDFSQVTADNCPVLDAHSKWSVKDQLGKVRGARCESNQVIGTCHFGASDGAKAVEADVAAGTPPKISAGYRREQAMFERFEGEVPVYRITKWSLREASFVPIAADESAGVRSGEQVIFPCIINEGVRAMRTEDNGAAAGGANDQGGNAQGGNGGEGQRADAQNQGGNGNDGQRADGGQNQGAGNARVTLFTGAAALAFVDQARAFGDPVAKRAQELVAANGRGEISVETANAQLLTASAEAQRAATTGISSGGARAEITADEHDKFIQGATNSIIQRAGLTEIVTRAAKLRGETIDLNPGEFRGVRNAELARMTLERAGVRVSSYDRDQIVGQALTAERSGMNTTSDFAVLLENVMHKTLQAAYAVAPDTWTRFCGIGSVVDFRAHPRYLRGTFGVLDSRTEAGEFKNKSIPDGAKESITASVKGNIVALTRDAIVNDDLGAFNFITVELGRAAKLSIEVDVYALLAQASGLGPVMGTDANTMFHATHGNIGTGGVPSVATFEELATLMAKQKDLSGNEYLDIRPSVLLVPIGLRGDSIVLNEAQYDPDTASKLQKPNKVRGLFDDVVATPAPDRHALLCVRR
jgi:hypothetical protein